MLLIVVPWSDFWESNYFLEIWPALGRAAVNPFVRGAITGFGVVNVCAGLADLFALVPWRRERQQVQQGSE